MRWERRSFAAMTTEQSENWWTRMTRSPNDTSESLHTAPPIDAYLVAQVRELTGRVEQMEALHAREGRPNTMRRLVGRLVGARHAGEDPSTPAEPDTP